MSSLPNKPWNEGDKFTNDATGVEYTFDGVKWLASGGEELDLSGFATDAELAQVNEASEFRDDALNVKIDDESTQNTAAHAVFTAGIADHEDRIAELEKAPQPDEVKLEGTLRWVDYTYNSDTIDALVNTIRVHTDRTKMSINWDTIDDGRKDWADLINDSVGLEVDGSIYWAMVEYVGEAGTSGRGKNFNIIEHNIPPAGEIAADSITGIWPNYTPPVNYATTEYVDDAIAAIPSELDDRYLQLTGGAMAANARINVDQIEPVDQERYIRYEAGRDKRYPFALANCGMVQDVSKEIFHEEMDKLPDYFPIGDWSDSEYEPHADLRAMDESYSQLYDATQKAQQITDGAQNRRLDALEENSSDFVSKSGDEIAGQLTIRKSTQVALDIVGDSNQSQIKFWSSGAVALQNYTAFKDNELVTKKYVDDKVGSGGGSSFTPGDKVAKTNGEATVVGGFWISNGALYCKVN